MVEDSNSRKVGHPLRQLNNLADFIVGQTSENRRRCAGSCAGRLAPFGFFRRQELEVDLGDLDRAVSEDLTERVD